MLRVLAAAILAATLPAGQAEAGDIDKTRMAEIARSSLERRDVPAAAVALIRDGKVVFSAVYGEQSGDTPATRRTLFNVASLTKPVAAETILRLIDARVFGLDEPMSGAYVDPDIADDPRTARLTPRLALSHQTGFPNWRDGALSFIADPGAGYGYSGEGYDYVAHYAEAKTGKTFPTLVRERVFDPLKMNSATLVATPRAKRRAARIRSSDGAWKSPDMEEDWTAADNLLVTIDDYARFVAQVARGAGLSPVLTEERRKMQVRQDLCGGGADPSCPNPAGFSLGWQRLEFGPRVFFFHTGEDWDSRAIAYFEPATRDGAVAFASSAEGMATNIDLLAALESDNPIVASFRTSFP